MSGGRQSTRAVRMKCDNNIGISLLSVPRNVCGGVLSERLMGVITGKASEEQGGIKGCVSQIFTIKW